MQERRVKMYTLSSCSHCRAAKKLLNELGVRFEYVDVDLLTADERRTIMEEIRRLNPSVSFPTIIIGDTIIIGNREEKIREALGLR